MPKMKIAVCDDEEFYRDELTKMITVYEMKRGASSLWTHGRAPPACSMQ